MIIGAHSPCGGARSSFFDSPRKLRRKFERPWAAERIKGDGTEPLKRSRVARRNTLGLGELKRASSDNENQIARQRIWMTTSSDQGDHRGTRLNVQGRASVPVAQVVPHGGKGPLRFKHPTGATSWCWSGYESVRINPISKETSVIPLRRSFRSFLADLGMRCSRAPAADNIVN